MNIGVKKWNIFFICFFIAIASLMYATLYRAGNLPFSVEFFDFTILTLATFRMVRLFVYDDIFLFLREGLMEKETVVIDGLQKTFFIPSHYPFVRTVYKLAVCPWCMGVWLALCSSYVFYLLPQSYLLFLVLAIAGVATTIQLLVNWIGWNAEHKKIETGRLS